MKLKPLAMASALSVMFVVSGCNTINPYTGETQTSKAAKGAGIGAAVGAILGAATGDKDDRLKRALIGAGIGGLAGGGVGAYMDVQEAKLRQELEGTGVSVTRNGDQIILNMPGNISFDSGSSEIKPSFLNVLHGVNLVLNKYEKTLITISGHTDSDGSNSYNQLLSEQRATNVASYFLNQGIQIERLAAIGYGETRPIASNATPEGKYANRRVELHLDPIVQQ